MLECFLNYPAPILALGEFQHVAQDLVYDGGFLLDATALNKLLDHVVSKYIVYQLMWFLNNF